MTCLLLVCHCSMDIRVAFQVTVSCFSFKLTKKSWSFGLHHGRSSLPACFHWVILGGCGTRQSGPRVSRRGAGAFHWTDALRTGIPWDSSPFFSAIWENMWICLELFRSYVKFCWCTFQEANVGGETSHIFWNFHTKNLGFDDPQLDLRIFFSDGLVKNHRLDHLHLEHTERYFHLTGWLIWRFLTALFFNIGI